MKRIKAWGARSASSGVAPMEIQRRALREDDVEIRIDHCGICHTDIHFVRDDWGRTVYPIVPGHEIVGTVTAIGPDVTGFEVGQRVGVGCMVDSCRICDACTQGLEQYCAEGFTATYNGEDRRDGAVTFGGYSDSIVVGEAFVLHMPESLDAAASAPLLCAGITTWSPLNHYGVAAGDRVGIVGMGGLGHMAIKFARALGAEVTVFTRSESKRDEALRLGAHDVVISTDTDAMARVAESFDYILDTVPVQHDVNGYLHALRHSGTLILVGLLEPIEPPLDAAAVVFRRRCVAGSLIGGIAETREMLDFCANHEIVCDIERIDIGNINEAYRRMQDSDVRYRFVIDMDTLRT